MGVDRGIERLAAAAAAVDVVLLDVGGVLFVDPWEHLLLAPGTGVSDQLGLQPSLLADAGRELWPRFSTSAGEEHAWWSAVGEAVGLTISAEVRVRAEEALLPTAWASQVLEAARRFRSVGVVTDNTSFWYERQRRALQLDAVVTPGLELVSCEVGVRKRDDPGLLHHAATLVDPTRTIVVDDRAHNLEAASALGFATLMLGRSADV